LANGRIDELRIGHKYNIFEPPRIEKLALPAEKFLHNLNYLKVNEFIELLFTSWKMRLSEIAPVVGDNISRDSNVKFNPHEVAHWSTSKTCG
jgi:hypothetical protein